MVRCIYDRRLICHYKEDCRKCSTFKKSGQTTINGSNPVQVKTTKIETIDAKQEYACPFCLTILPLSKFLISSKKGYDQKRGKCPECGNGMLLKSLTAEMKPEEYADWVADYVGYGFWQKIPYTTWRNNLEKLGWAQPFWRKYNERKGEWKQETYEEVLNRQAQEEWNTEEAEPE